MVAVYVVHVRSQSKATQEDCCQKECGGCGAVARLELTTSFDERACRLGTQAANSKVACGR
jgi:hypothetical protein